MRSILMYKNDRMMCNRMKDQREWYLGLDVLLVAFESDGEDSVRADGDAGLGLTATLRHAQRVLHVLVQQLQALLHRDHVLCLSKDEQ